MRSCAFAAAVLAFGTSLGGCAQSVATKKVAVDFNRVFAKSREEVLVTNILRASAREPLQFSTMGAVQGGVSPTGEISFPFSDFFGTEGLKVTLKHDVNPTLNIVPLENKDFAEGILKPVPLATANYFLSQGWDPEFVLTMLVGGVVCADGTIVTNRGNRSRSGPAPHYDDFARMFTAAGASRKPIIASIGRELTTTRMPAKQAAALLKDGVGAGRKVLVEPVLSAGKITDKVNVTIAEEPELQFINLKTAEVCGEHDAASTPSVALLNPQLAKVNKEASKVMLRSVEAIIYFLGETHRELWPYGKCTTDNGSDSERWPYYRRVRSYASGEETIGFLHIDRACTNDAVPIWSFLSTRFNGRNYYVAPAPENQVDQLGHKLDAHCDVDATDRRYCDRTLTTLSFLDELIALQTNPSSITSATPVVNVGPK
jgi:hypothetical protein